MNNLILVFLSVLFCVQSFSQSNYVKECNSIILSITEIMDSFPNRNLLKDSIIRKRKKSVELKTRRDSVKFNTIQIHNKFELIYKLLVKQERLEERYYEKRIKYYYF